MLDFLAVLELESAFHHLSKSDGVAGAASFLVSHFASVVKSRDVPPIKVLGELVVWDLGSRAVLLLPLLSLLEGGLEVVAFAKLLGRLNLG